MNISKEDLVKADLIEEVRSICEEAGIEFLFIIPGRSCWNISEDEHLKEVKKFHKETE